MIDGVVDASNLLRFDASEEGVIFTSFSNVHVINEPNLLVLKYPKNEISFVVSSPKIIVLTWWMMMDLLRL